MKIIYFGYVLFVIRCLLGLWVNGQHINESETISFFYNPKSQNLILRTYQPVHRISTCYVITLTDEERQQIHTDDGLREIEIRRLAMLISAKPTTADQLNHWDRNSCGHAQPNGTLSYYIM